MHQDTVSAQVEVGFRYTEADYVEAQRLFKASQPVQRWLDRLLYVLALVGVGVGFLIRWSGNSQTAIPVFAAAIFLTVFALLGPTMHARWARRDFKKHPYLSGDMRYVFTEEVVEMSGPTGTSSTQWGMFSRWLESRALFMLLAGERLFFIVPKRSLTEQQLGSFRALLTRKIPSATNPKALGR